MYNNFKDNNSLPELFKELQDIRSGKVKAYENPNDNFIKKRSFNPFFIIPILLFIIIFAMILSNNYIFAKTTDEPKKQIGEFEQNEDSLDLNKIISENISEVTSKEILTKEEIISFETKYVENNQLPKNEKNILQRGSEGKRELIVIDTYENNQLIDENIIKDTIIKKANVEIIEVGTSKFLEGQKVHIGDTLYTTREVEITDGRDEIGKVYQYIDIKLLEAGEDKCKIKVDGIEGYVASNSIVSAYTNPSIVEKSRIKRILLNVNFDMPLNKPSGLTLDDFKKVLSGNSRDVNHIFENNAELFYNIEKKYKINGLFVAAIGIHESNWGTSTIANDKRNLFGYGAYDSSPYYSSVNFESYEAGIELVAKSLVKYYLNESGTSIYDNEKAVGSYYNGATVSGVNVRYASDQNWCNKVYSIMESLYKKL